MQIPTISIMDDFCFAGLWVVQTQKLGRYILMCTPCQGHIFATTLQLPEASSHYHEYWIDESDGFEDG